MLCDLHSIRMSMHRHCNTNKQTKEGIDAITSINNPGKAPVGSFSSFVTADQAEKECQSASISGDCCGCSTLLIVFGCCIQTLCVQKIRLIEFSTWDVQVDRLHSEKGCLQKEKTDLQRTVTELGSSIDKMHRDKVALESQMEMEEEGIVNRLNRCAFL